jgi:hypothetical protein
MNRLLSPRNRSPRNRSCYSPAHKLYFFAAVLEGRQIILSECGSFLPCLRKINVKWCIIFADEGSCWEGGFHHNETKVHTTSRWQKKMNIVYSSLIVYLPPSISRTASVASRQPLYDGYMGHRLLAASLSTH